MSFLPHKNVHLNILQSDIFMRAKKLRKSVKMGSLKIYAILIYARKRLMDCNVWCNKN